MKGFSICLHGLMMPVEWNLSKTSMHYFYLFFLQLLLCQRKHAFFKEGANRGLLLEEQASPLPLRSLILLNLTKIMIEILHLIISRIFFHEAVEIMCNETRLNFGGKAGI